MVPLRTGIIGCGYFARKRHAPILAALDETELVAFYDHHLENSISFNQDFADGQGRAYQDCQKMFEESRLDLVYICLPPFAHDNEVALACQYGVHFLIEKPIALTMEAARAMAHCVEESGVKSQVGFMYRFGEAVTWLSRHIKAQGGAQGFMIAHYYCNALHRWWWRDRSRSGGQLVEQVIHLLDLTRFFFGEPVRIYSAQSNLFHQDVPDYTIEDVSATVIQFRSGAVATVAASNGAIPDRWESDFRIILPGLTADFQDANHAVFHYTSQEWESTTTVKAEKDLYLTETLDLLTAIREDRATAVPIEEGVRSLKLALTAARSAEQNIPLNLT